MIKEEQHRAAVVILVGMVVTKVPVPIALPLRFKTRENNCLVKHAKEEKFPINNKQVANIQIGQFLRIARQKVNILMIPQKIHRCGLVFLAPTVVIVRITVQFVKFVHVRAIGGCPGRSTTLPFYDVPISPIALASMKLKRKNMKKQKEIQHLLKDVHLVPKVLFAVCALMVSIVI